MSYEDDDMPELEDLSEELGKMRTSNNESSEIKVNVIQQEKPISIPVTEGKQEKKEETSFKFKKGFFLQNQQTESQTQTQTLSQPQKPLQDKNTTNSPIDLTHIKSDHTETVKGKLINNVKSEIKSSLESSELVNNIMGRQNEWLTPDLFAKFAQKPHLLKFFIDPKFGEVIKLMQKDPQKAKELYGHNKELNEFMKEFSTIMAEHFNKLGQQPPVNTNGDKEVEEILKDPKVSDFIKKLQTDGRIDMTQLQCDNTTFDKIRKLIDKGILKLER
jgi:hypothetical protein